MNRSARPLFSSSMHLPSLRHAGLIAARVLMFAAWFGLSVWAAGVVFYNVWGGAVLVWLYVAAMACAFVFRRKRPVFWRASWGVLALLLAYYLCIPATNGKEWQPSWSRLPAVEINGNEIVVKDVRSFVYRTERDFDARYVTRRFDLDKLSTLDFAVSHWDGMEFVAHTMLSFGFEDGRHLALSVETRLPEGVEQGTIPGLYKQFNVIYILADEEDLFGLRTSYRKEDMYLYRINIGRENLKKAFLGFAEKSTASTNARVTTTPSPPTARRSWWIRSRTTWACAAGSGRPSSTACATRTPMTGGSCSICPEKTSVN